jgi:pilin isopeptide linkage protein
MKTVQLKIIRKVIAIGMALLLTVGTIPFQTFAAEASTATVSLQVESQVTEEQTDEAAFAHDLAAEDAAAFTYILIPEDETNPMPSSDAVTIRGNGTAEFGPITYNKAGVYNYTIQVRDEQRPGYKYDKTVYHVAVNVADTNGGKFSTGITLRKNQEDAKSAAIVFVNELEPTTTTVKFSKQDVSGKELPGATIQLVDKDGKVVEEWISDGTVHDFTVEPGSYQIVEKAAPEGYKIATTISFTVAEDGTVTSNGTTVEGNAPIIMVDDVAETETTKVSMGFDKVDAQTGERVSGAVLRIVDAKGVTVDEWTSNGSIHTITSGLTAGETYRLIEVEAPNGYKFAKDIQFTAAQDVNIVMTDEVKPEDQNASISVTKQLTCSGNIIGAKDQAFYVALYEDQACTYRVSEIKKLQFTMASSATVTFDGLEPNKTYYIGEADANGINLVSGMVDDGTLFVTDFIQGQAVTASSQEGAASLKFLNEFYEVPNNFYVEGEVVVTKKLVDANGNAKASNETFYAGIFADPQFTILSDQVTSNILELSLNGTSEASATVVAMLPESGNLQLYVTEVDADGIPVSGNSSFVYKVSIDGSDISLNAQNTSAVVTITNQLPAETVTTEKPAQSTTTGTTATSVKTGDDTPMELYLILLAASAVILLIAVKIRRRRKA